MTFVLNILHKDFSVLVCDEQGGMSGTAEVKTTSGSPITLNSPRITINGINKLFTNRPRTLAVGVTGQLQNHTYAARLHETEDVIGALEMIHSHIGALHARGDRRVVIENRPVTLNEGLATFFDAATDEFFTDMFFFTPKNIHSRRHHVSTGKAILLHVGSGSRVLENAVGLDNINAFLGALRETQFHSACKEWITQAYKQVNEKNVGCGADFMALCATRNAPVFSDLVVSA